MTTSTLVLIIAVVAVVANGFSALAKKYPNNKYLHVVANVIAALSAFDFAKIALVVASPQMKAVLIALTAIFGASQPNQLPSAEKKEESQK